MSTGGVWVSVGGVWISVGGLCVSVGGAWVSVGGVWVSVGGVCVSVGGVCVTVGGVWVLVGGVWWAPERDHIKCASLVLIRSCRVSRWVRENPVWLLLRGNCSGPEHQLSNCFQNIDSSLNM